MTPHHDDLRAALRPLTCDPRDDAARVMTALGQPRPAPWKTLPWVLLGAAAGFAVSFLLRDGTAPPAVSEPGPVAIAPQPEQQTEPGAPPATPTTRIVRGDALVEASGRFHSLRADQALGYENRISTKYGAAEIGLPDQSVLRLGSETGVELFGPREVQLAGGRLWVLARPDSTPLQIWLDDAGRVEVADGIVDIGFGKDGLRVVAARGKAALHADGERFDLAAGQCFERSAGVPGEVQACNPTDETFWIAPFLGHPINAAERTRRLEDLVRQLAKPDQWKAADRQIRAVGTGAISTLALAMDLAPDPEVQHRLAILIADLASIDDEMLLMRFLEAKAPEVRVHAFRAMRRLTATTPPGADEDEFWRTAPPLVRERAIEQWWQLLRYR